MSAQMIDPISTALDANAAPPAGDPAAAPPPAQADQATGPAQAQPAQQTPGADQQQQGQEPAQQQEGEQAAAEDAALQKMSSYQRQKAKYETQITELQTKQQELELWKAEREAQDGTFVGIKADEPNQTWEPLAQVQALPPGHQQKLVKTVIDNYLSAGIEEAVNNPEAYAKDLTRYAQATAALVEFAWSRPTPETADIMGM